jgi:hypothetical protein
MGPVSLRTNILLSLLLVSAFALYLAGCLVFIFSVSNYSQGKMQNSLLYSIVNLGKKLPESAVDGHLGMYVWLEIIWYVLGVALPLLSCQLFLAILWVPLSRSALERLFFAAEVVFAWSSAEVFVLSTIFAVAQIPKFGNGLISSGCTLCFVVQSQMLSELSILALGAVLHVVASCWCFAVVHKVIYRDRLMVRSSRSRVSAARCSCSWLRLCFNKQERS